MTISDPLEKQVAAAFDSRGIRWLHEDEKGNDAALDFYLPDYDLYVEVKRFFTPRSSAQLERAKNVILVQGTESVEWFVNALLSCRTDRLNP